MEQLTTFSCIKIAVTLSSVINFKYILYKLISKQKKNATFFFNSSFSQNEEGGSWLSLFFAYFMSLFFLISCFKTQEERAWLRDVFIIYSAQSQSYATACAGSTRFNHDHFRLTLSPVSIRFEKDRVGCIISHDTHTLSFFLCSALLNGFKWIVVRCLASVRNSTISIIIPIFLTIGLKSPGASLICLRFL